MMVERNDPTHAGFTPPATGSVRLSGNEIEALCQKAARGAGLSWGLAEEAGYAARWLHARGLDGCGALLAHLDRLSGPPSRVIWADGALSAENGGLLSPIVVGAALSDFAALREGCVRARAVNRPVLVLPFVHQIAAARRAPVALTSTAGRVVVSAAGDLAGDAAALASAESAELSVSPATEAHAAAAAPSGSSLPRGETLARLNDFAMLTCVPASDASRADAGSSDGDND